MLSWTIGLSRLANAQPAAPFSHQTTSACRDSKPGSVSQQIDPWCIRLTAVAEKPLNDRSFTTVWNARFPDARNWAGIIMRVLGEERSSCEAISYRPRVFCILIAKQPILSVAVLTVLLCTECPEIVTGAFPNLVKRKFPSVLDEGCRSRQPEGPRCAHQPFPAA